MYFLHFYFPLIKPWPCTGSKCFEQSDPTSQFYFPWQFLQVVSPFHILFSLAVSQVRWELPRHNPNSAGRSHTQTHTHTHTQKHELWYKTYLQMMSQSDSVRQDQGSGANKSLVGCKNLTLFRRAAFYICHETTFKTLHDVRRAVKDVSFYLIALQHKQQLIRGVWGRGIWCHPSYAGWILQGWVWYETITDLELMGCLHSKKAMLCKWAHGRPMLLLLPHTQRGREREAEREDKHLPAACVYHVTAAPGVAVFRVTCSHAFQTA